MTTLQLARTMLKAVRTDLRYGESYEVSRRCNIDGCSAYTDRDTATRLFDSSVTLASRYPERDTWTPDDTSDLDILHELDRLGFHDELSSEDY